MSTLDHEGLHTDAPSSISLYSGGRFDPLNPDPDELNIIDIAHALARTVRYNGHVGHFLSVARHSIWVSRACPPELRLCGLLHDASEAYIGDMVKPLKHDPSMVKFRDVEQGIEAAIAVRFNLPFPMPADVREADRFVTVEYEIGEEARWSHDTTYQRDEIDFLHEYHSLTSWTD